MNTSRATKQGREYTHRYHWSTHVARVVTLLAVLGVVPRRGYGSPHGTANHPPIVLLHEGVGTAAVGGSTGALLLLLLLLLLWLLCDHVVGRGHGLLAAGVTCWLHHHAVGLLRPRNVLGHVGWLRQTHTRQVLLSLRRQDSIVTMTVDKLHSYHRTQ